MLISVLKMRLFGRLECVFGGSWSLLEAKMRPRWDLGLLECLLEASWGRLGGLLEPLGGQDEAKMGSWRQLGGNLAEDGEEDEVKMS